MPEAKLRDGRVFIGEQFSVSFQRTQQVSDNLYASLPPPSWGVLPVHAVVAHLDRAPQNWTIKDSFFIPLCEGEALWLGFGGSTRKPKAVKVGVGERNAVSGRPWVEGLDTNPQGYLVCPPQMFLEGRHYDDGSVSQLLHGQGEAEARNDEMSRIRLVVYEPQDDSLSQRSSPPARSDSHILDSEPDGPASLDNSLGRKIEREIHTDPYGLDLWARETYGSVVIYAVSGERYEEITGRQPPSHPSPQDVYTRRLLP